MTSAPFSSTSQATKLLTAKAYWETEMPGALGLIYDQENTLAADTQKALRWASGKGLAVGDGGQLSHFAWDLFYTVS